MNQLCFKFHYHHLLSLFLLRLRALNIIIIFVNLICQPFSWLNCPHQIKLLLSTDSIWSILAFGIIGAQQTKDEILDEIWINVLIVVWIKKNQYVRAQELVGVAMLVEAKVCEKVFHVWSVNSVLDVSYFVEALFNGLAYFGWNVAKNVILNLDEFLVGGRYKGQTIMWFHFRNALLLLCFRIILDEAVFVSLLIFVELSHWLQIHGGILGLLLLSRSQHVVLLNF